MKNNVKIAKQLIKLAKNLISQEKGKIIKFTDFIKMNIDVDTADGITDWQTAFVGPTILTDYGKKVFKNILNIDILLYTGYGFACGKDLTKSQADLFRYFLTAAAGYISQYEYNKLFNDTDAEQLRNDNTTIDDLIPVPQIAYLIDFIRNTKNHNIKQEIINLLRQLDDSSKLPKNKIIKTFTKVLNNNKKDFYDYCKKIYPIRKDKYKNISDDDLEKLYDEMFNSYIDFIPEHTQILERYLLEDVIFN